jgi:hypothetical protein
MQYERALNQLDANPDQTLSVMDSILSNDKIQKRECNLKIEGRGGVARTFEFYPLQTRARACLKLADRDPKKAVELVERAVQDLKESARLGVKSSERMLQEARARLEALRKADAPETEAEAEFRRQWFALIDAGRFTEAKAHIDAQGGLLSAAQRQDYAAQTEKECRAHIQKVAHGFVAALARTPSPSAVMELTADEFKFGFPLTNPGLLVVSTPVYDWCWAVRSTLEKLRAGQEALDDLLGHAVVAAERGDGAAFRAIEPLCYELLAAEIDRRAVESRTAPGSRLEELRGEVDGLLASWRSFEERAQAASKRKDLLKGLPARDPASLAERLARRAEGLDEIRVELEECARAADPERRLAEIEKRLEAIREWERLNLESRRSLLACRILAGALRGFLAGKSVDAVVQDLQTRGFNIQEAGGPLEEKRFGPKIEQVFERLR